MHNPAADLLDLFDKWEEAVNYAENQVDLHSDDGWQELSLAVSLLAEITDVVERLSARGIRVGSYRDALPEWRKSVFHYPRSWPQQRMTLSRRDMLEGLAMWFESANMPALQDVLPDDVLQRLDKIGKTVSEDPDLDPSLKNYIGKLISHLRSVLDGDRAGFGFDAQESFRHLKFCMDAAAEQTQSEEKKKWYQSTAAEWAAQFVTSTAAGVGSQWLALAIGM
ncbi:hypothetical protein EAE32_06425 [Kocuria tytonicola]|uniref:Uncharacterized protein n=1 Tax=Kocuria tytonicola TaxID=2055946 RepID=A0A3L9L7F8_9MICC|nr:hypothetical protein [Kocuria tytonicola]RLY94770.1 hypothetical protein EAE32_06425 [Kocuria tytonicola]